MQLKFAAVFGAGHGYVPLGRPCPVFVHSVELMLLTAPVKPLNAKSSTSADVEEWQESQLVIVEVHTIGLSPWHFTLLQVEVPAVQSSVLFAGVLS
jgi:hypothetical protein